MKNLRRQHTQKGRPKNKFLMTGMVLIDISREIARINTNLPVNLHFI